MGHIKKIKISFMFQVSCFKLKCFVLLFSIGLTLPLIGQASQVFFEPAEITAPVNSISEIKVFLTAEKGEDINALEINMEYPTEFVKLKDWSNGNSIISLWIKEPKNNNGTFSFQGIIPGGYNEKKGLLMVLYFESLKEGDAEIAIKDDSLVLLNDGEGTEAKTLFSSAKIISESSAEGAPRLEFTENIPPEPFTPIISHSDEIYGGNYFLIFSTQDKNSGINYYEVSEGGEPFRIAQSPYLLRNQRLDEDIKVKAVDKAGNERMEMVAARQAKKIKERKITEPELILLGILLLAVVVIFAKYVYTKIRRTKIKK